jgi:acyl-CoA dehydrogenase
MVEQLFDDVQSLAERQPEQAWQQVCDFGLPRLLLPESADGFAECWSAAADVFRLLGEKPLPLPVGETLVAQALLHAAAPEYRCDTPIILLSCASAQLLPAAGGQFELSASIPDVPLSALSAQGSYLLLDAKIEGTAYIALLSPEYATQTDGYDTAAGERRTTFQFDRCVFNSCWPRPTLTPSVTAAGALLRSGQILGALQRALSLTIQYTAERQQFGRALVKFQVIQHELARLAEQVALVQSAFANACAAADYNNAAFEIAATKLLANKAIPIATSIAHQLHGAIGFTAEHALHRATLPLMVWQSDFGGSTYWAEVAGRILLEQRPDSAWQFITARSDALSAQAAGVNE